MADATTIGLPAEANGNVEGWLAPGSYELAEGETAESLITQMVAATKKQLDDLGVSVADREKVLTKASILEREVRNPEYLPMVSRVINNRLADTNGETRGLLQMDSTVLYGVGKLVVFLRLRTLQLTIHITHIGILDFPHRLFLSRLARPLMRQFTPPRGIGCTL